MYSKLLHEIMGLVKANVTGKKVIDLTEYKNYSKGDIQYIAKSIIDCNFSDHFWKLGCNLNHDCSEVVYSYNPDAVKPAWVE